MIKKCIKKCLSIPMLATAKWRRLPEFLIIGAQKSGTTSLFHYLTEHQTVLKNPLRHKEIYFFNKKYEKGIQYYRHYFPLKWSRGEVGEATTTYLHDDHTALRVHAHIPDVKLIVILRDPCERAISHYYHQVVRGRETRSLEEAFSASILHRYEAGIQKDGWSYGYLFNGDYGRHLEEWLKYFDRAQLYVGKAENMFSEPQLEFDRICDFLEIERQQMDCFSVQNQGGKKAHDPEVVLRLREFYQPKVMHLKSLGLEDLDWEYYE